MSATTAVSLARLQRVNQRNLIEELEGDKNLAFCDWEESLIEHQLNLNGELSQSVAYVENGRLKGFLLGGISNGIACINHLWIRGDARGNGLSSKLVREFLCQEDNLRMAYAIVVSGNDDAIRFFTRSRFTMFGTPQSKKLFFEKDLDRTGELQSPACKPPLCELLGFRGSLGASVEEHVTNIPFAEAWFRARGIFRVHLITPGTVSNEMLHGIEEQGYKMPRGETLFTAYASQIEDLKRA